VGSVPLIEPLTAPAVRIDYFIAGQELVDIDFGIAAGAIIDLLESRCPMPI